MQANLEGERLGKFDSNGADGSSLSEPKSIASGSCSCYSSGLFAKSSPSSKIISSFSIVYDHVFGI